MPDVDLDSIDRAIIHALQADARHTSSSTIAEDVGVSASTVRNRIARLEETGIVRGYHADVDYERAGYQLYTLIVCTAPIPQREELARDALDIEGVVSVREVMTGAENVHIGVVGTDGDDLSRIGRELNDLGFEIVDEDLIRNDFANPYHGFERTD
ncbi:Lrp/AsnC family transcriptional regulator [Halomarina oriensis]|uniref:AsnC family transcriptional regulator n=1 Tax=Halomarina oriensis TaxID=671145 RepID=A0A6B0GKF8_9EURY|nr:Lrp/AsnC family transcriptional regulator [Halomarina oriensis]MWG35342.1 AsnC family transcriptional regulator [Halomarina oriensis]